MNRFLLGFSLVLAGLSYGVDEVKGEDVSSRTESLIKRITQGKYKQLIRDNHWLIVQDQFKVLLSDGRSIGVNEDGVITFAELSGGETDDAPAWIMPKEVASKLGLMEEGEFYLSLLTLATPNPELIEVVLRYVAGESINWDTLSNDDIVLVIKLVVHLGVEKSANVLNCNLIQALSKVLQNRMSSFDLMNFLIERKINIPENKTALVGLDVCFNSTGKVVLVKNKSNDNVGYRAYRVDELLGGFVPVGSINLGNSASGNVHWVSNSDTVLIECIDEDHNVKIRAYKVTAGGLVQVKFSAGAGESSSLELPGCVCFSSPTGNVVLFDLSDNRDICRFSLFKLGESGDLEQLNFVRAGLRLKCIDCDDAAEAKWSDNGNVLVLFQPGFDENCGYIVFKLIENEFRQLDFAGGGPVFGSEISMSPDGTVLLIRDTEAGDDGREQDYFYSYEITDHGVFDVDFGLGGDSKIQCLDDNSLASWSSNGNMVSIETGAGNFKTISVFKKGSGAFFGLEALTFVEDFGEEHDSAMGLKVVWNPKNNIFLVKMNEGYYAYRACPEEDRVYALMFTISGSEHDYCPGCFADWSPDGTVCAIKDADGYRLFKLLGDRNFQELNRVNIRGDISWSYDSSLAMVKFSRVVGKKVRFCIMDLTDEGLKARPHYTFASEEAGWVPNANMISGGYTGRGRCVVISDLSMLNVSAYYQASMSTILDRLFLKSIEDGKITKDNIEPAFAFLNIKLRARLKRFCSLFNGGEVVHDESVVAAAVVVKRKVDGVASASDDEETVKKDSKRQRPTEDPS